MTNNKPAQPPQRKEPGLVGKTISWIMAMIFWLLVSLLISIVIEWVGIAYVWPEQGSEHAAKLLAHDLEYLDARVTEHTSPIVQSIRGSTYRINGWVDENLRINSDAQWRRQAREAAESTVGRWLAHVHHHYDPYIASIPKTMQIFFVRLAIIILSLPSFLLFGAIGMVDGLVERDLRRWGGGRESSVIYNIARKSVFRLFIAACVIYLSFPIAIAPAWVIIPFAMVFGLSVRVTFERFKKYF